MRDNDFSKKWFLTRLVRMIAPLAMLGAVFVSGCGGDTGNDGATPTTAAYTELRSTVPFFTQSVANANVQLIKHTMPAWSGGTAMATTLLFIPKGTPPVGGWPVLAWAHGTTTVSTKSCAPSQTPDALDGGLTAEGFTSHYADLISSYVAAGYAVVAPDFEGLGNAATTPFPYYSSASESRSLVAGVKAAHLASANLSPRWMALGHSEGGRGVLALHKYLDEVPELNFLGSVAYAPYVSIAASVDKLGSMAAADPANATLYLAIQNFFVAMMSTALETNTSNIDVSQFMGADLAAVRHVFREQCIFSSFGRVQQAIQAKSDSTFAGFKSRWSEVPAMKNFLATNDIGTDSNFRLRAPTLIVQGTADVFVLEPLTTALVHSLSSNGSTVSYRLYNGSDHGTIVKDASADVLTFISTRFAQ